MPARDRPVDGWLTVAPAAGQPATFVGGAHLAVGRRWPLGPTVGLPLARLSISAAEVTLMPVVRWTFGPRLAARDEVLRVAPGRLGGVRVDAPRLRHGGFVFRPWSSTRDHVLEEFRVRGYPVATR